jgi:hypothetical protein
MALVHTAIRVLEIALDVSDARTTHRRIKVSADAVACNSLTCA